MPRTVPLQVAPPSAPDSEAGPEVVEPAVSVIIPTYNEAENVPVLTGRLQQVLAGLSYELIVVDDDSPDHTWAAATAAGRRDARIKCIRRTDARGLSSAVLTGMYSACGRTLAVIDADLQHDVSILPAMVARVAGGADVCIGSREAEGGSYGSWSWFRRFASWCATRLARFATGVTVSDPMSGYFVISRDWFERTSEQVNPRGFKILLEFLARERPRRLEEVGYRFGRRQHGETKFGTTVILDYLVALIDLRFGHVVSAQFVKYGLVGMTGMAVNLLGYLGARLLGVPVLGAVLVGVELSILWNFFANNFFTFRQLSYHRRRLLQGLTFFQLISLHGLLVQLAVFHLLATRWPFGPMAFTDALLANAFAIAVAAVGNYFLHANYTWRRILRHPPDAVGVRSRGPGWQPEQSPAAVLEAEGDQRGHLDAEGGERR